MAFDRTNHFNFLTAWQHKFISCVFLVACLPAFAIGQVATPDKFTLAEGFEAELVYSVAKGQGSWVSLTTDPKGRLIACDQYGAIYRITVTDGKADVVELKLNLGAAQGLLCAFDSLYVMSSGIKGKDLTCNRGFTESETPTVTISTTKLNICKGFSDAANTVPTQSYSAPTKNRYISALAT